MTSDEIFPAVESIDDAHRLAQAIVDTVREPLLVLDSDLRIVVASRSFHSMFETTPQRTRGRKLHDLNGKVWDIPELQALLEKIAPEHGVMEAFEVERDVPPIGRRTMLLNARKVFYEHNGHTTILLGFEDVTERRRSEHALQKLLEQKQTLLEEMSHRVANSLQIIASILLMKARTVDSPETRLHLEDAHRRVMSVASVQQHLQASGMGENVAVGPYLSKLCESLAASMIGDNRPIILKVVAGDGEAQTRDAVSLGLVVTEMVINALKHAFPDPAREGLIVVGFEVDGADWKLSISDNGVGMPNRTIGEKPSGLGMSLIKALAQQLDSQVEIATSPKGTTVSLTHATFVSRLPTAA